MVVIATSLLLSIAHYSLDSIPDSSDVRSQLRIHGVHYTLPTMRHLFLLPRGGSVRMLRIMTVTLTPLKHEHVTLTPLKHEDVTLTPIKHEDATLTPLKHHDVTLTPHKYEDVTLTPLKHEDVTLTPLKHHDVTLTPHKYEDLTPSPNIAVFVIKRNA